MRNKKVSIVLLSLVMVLAIGQSAFAQNYVGGLIGYHSNNMIVLGEWRNETGLNSEVYVVAGIETDFHSFKIPAEIAWKYDFVHINFANRNLGRLSFGVKAGANATLAFNDNGGGIALGAGLYGDWKINSKWKVYTDFSILNLRLMPSPVDFRFGADNLTGVQYNINSATSVKAEFGYNRFIGDKGFYVGVGVGRAF